MSGSIRLLRDQNVNEQYVDAFAVTNDWVVFTGDDDFERDLPFGVVLYHQEGLPAPGVVLDAIELIADAYADHGEILEYVPGQWV
ncbi:hypothetical protein [Halomarina pelagica]|uniref:hypothetical protein n=1 Tax=Halomarina pelagica TaxID=2961599 RepID=UPI0034A36ACC